jgi:N-methylhydantoinase A/oxoprolinase/acetone carboxylase beta subunit
MARERKKTRMQNDEGFWRKPETSMQTPSVQTAKVAMKRG